MSGRVGTVVLLLAVVATGACAPPGDGSMVSLPPPRSWESDLVARRTSKNQYFKSAPDTPLPAEAVASFEGLDYWEPDARFYFAGDLHLYGEPEQFEIPTTAGGMRPCEKYGWIGFVIDGVPQRLQVYRLLDMPPGPEAMLVPFRDGTTGQETYPAGRYVELEGRGPFVLDFNVAYNPSCAYGDAARFSCPRTPPENTLSVRIEAGERGFHPASEPRG